MDEQTRTSFYIGASLLFDLDSSEVDQILADAGLDAVTDSLARCRAAIREHVGETTWQRGYESGRLLFGNGQLTVDDVAPGDELISIAEAARILDVTVQAVSQAVNSGRLRSYVDPTAPARQGRRLVSRDQVNSL